MRTTVNLSDPLFIEAKKLAAEHRTSFTQVLEESLRLYLNEERAARRRQRSLPPLPVLREASPVDGIDLDDTSSLLELE